MSARTTKRFQTGREVFATYAPDSPVLRKKKTAEQPFEDPAVLEAIDAAVAKALASINLRSVKRSS